MNLWPICDFSNYGKCVLFGTRPTQFTSELRFRFAKNNFIAIRESDCTANFRYLYIKYKYKCTLCTIDQELALARSFVFTHQVVAVFCVKWRHGRHLENVTSNRRLHQSKRIYMKNSSAKFHTDPIWHDEALACLKSLLQRGQQQEEQDE